MKKIVFTIIILLLMPLIGLAQDPVAEETADAVPTWVNILASLSTLILGVLAIIWGIARAWLLKKGVLKEKSLQEVEKIVIDLKNNLVRELKAKRKDGKLTKKDLGEIKSALMKRVKAVEWIDLLKVIGEDYLPVVVEKILGNTSRPSENGGK